VPVPAYPALVEEESALAVFARVMSPFVALYGQPEESDHVESLCRPVLLSHGFEHPVFSLPKFLP